MLSGVFSKHSCLLLIVFDHLIYKPMQNALGTTAMSVPSRFIRDGLPIGSHFIGRARGEATLFGLAFELEQLQPWADNWAPHAGVRRVVSQIATIPLYSELYPAVWH